MEPFDYPPNSDASRRSGRVTTGDVKIRKRSLRRQFMSLFISGDPRNAAQYSVLDILLPGARELVAESAMEFISKLISGESRRRGGYRPPSGPQGPVPYSRISMGGTPLVSPTVRHITRSARALHNFDEIILQDRTEAEVVLDSLSEAISRYGRASVGELYEFVGVRASHTDNKWGWTSLRGAKVSRTHGGYLLDLPDPEPLD